MANVNSNKIAEDMVKASRGINTYQPDYMQTNKNTKESAPKEEYKFKGKGGNEFSVQDGRNSSNSFGGSSSTGTTGTTGTTGAGLGSSTGNSSSNKFSVTQGNISNRTDAKTQVESFDNGYYNGFKKHEMDRASDTVRSTVTNQYQQSDTYQGYDKVQTWGRIAGVGSASRSASKANLEKFLYNRKDYDNSLDSVLGKGYVHSFQDENGKVKVSNVVTDYNNNVRIVEDALRTRYNINGQNLNIHEIDRALKKGEVSGIAHLGGKAKINDPEARKLLTELKILREQKNSFKQYQRAQGGLKNTAGTWTKEMLSDSDAYAGYRFAKKVGKVGLAAGKLGKAGAVGAVKGVVGTGYNVGRAKLWAEGKINSSKIKQLEKKGIGGDELKRLKDKGVNIVEKKGKLRTDKMNVKYAIDKYSSPISLGKSKLSRKVGNLVNKIPGIAHARILGNRIKNSMFAKVIRSPFSLFNLIKRAIRKVVIALGVLLIVFLILWIVIMAVIGITGDQATSYDDRTQTIQDSAAQKMIDYLYSWQEAYTENVFECSTDTEQGRIWAAKRLPNSWFDQIRLSDPSLMSDANVVSVEYDGAIAGFNFGKYWGPRAWTWGGGQDAAGNVPVYETAISDTWEVGGDDGYTDYETHTVYLKFYGNAGLMGDIGEYDMPSVRECWENGIDELEFNINGNSENPGTWSEAYEKWEDPSYLNPDIECNFTYLGSRYSYAVTKEKYTQFYNSYGKLQKYGIDEFYKALLIFSMGVLNNDNSDASFSTMYTKEVFDDIMENAKVTLTYEYAKTDDGAEPMVINMNVDGSTVPLVTNDYYKCIVSVDVFLQDTGITDMMYRDSRLNVVELDGTSWVHHGEVGNEWVHSPHKFYNIESRLLDQVVTVKSEHVYVTQNRADNGYRAWYTEQQEENKLPLWGMTQWENDDRTMLLERTYPADGFPRLYSEVMDNCVAYFDLAPDELEAIFGELSFPSGWLATLSQIEIERILSNTQQWYLAQGLDPSSFANAEEMIKFVLQTIGRYGYVYGMHCTGDWANYNGRGFDCSGYISYLLQAMGKIPNGAYYSCGKMVDGSMGYPVTSYSGNPSSLKPGDLVVKEASYGASTKAGGGSTNHVVMYVGKLQLEGDTEPRDYFAECTTSGKVKGSQLTRGDSTRISNYKYVVHTG